jgi:hypothetical protein
MSESAKPGIASDAEIQSALAEAEREVARIPSLDDGREPQIVPVPVQPPPMAAPAPHTPPSVERLVVETAMPIDTPTPAARVATGDPPGRAAVAPLPSGTPTGGLLYRTLDGILWAINRPFDGLAPEARQLVGWLAIVTLAMSTSAPFVLKWLVPSRDPVAQLSRQTAAVRAAPPAAAEPKPSVDRPAAKPSAGH